MIRYKRCFYTSKKTSESSDTGRPTRPKAILTADVVQFGMERSVAGKRKGPVKYKLRWLRHTRSRGEVVWGWLRHTRS